MAQSALFIAIFYRIQIIWDRDAGILANLMTTPTPLPALVSGKGFAAGVRAIAQVAVVLVVATILGVSFDWNPPHLLGAIAAVLLGSAFFSTLSVTIARLVLTRDRLMGVGQAITMPLFFASNALYPVALMPGWVRAVALVNPLSYEVNALRGLLLGIPASLPLDVGVPSALRCSASSWRPHCSPASLDEADQDITDRRPGAIGPSAQLPNASR
jgi:ABC-2 type transport system permease protein